MLILIHLYLTWTTNSLLQESLNVLLLSSEISYRSRDSSLDFSPGTKPPKSLIILLEFLPSFFRDIIKHFPVLCWNQDILSTRFLWYSKLANYSSKNKHSLMLLALVNLCRFLGIIVILLNWLENICLLFYLEYF